MRLEHSASRGRILGGQTSAIEGPRSVCVLEGEERVIVDHGVLAATHLPHRLAGHVRQVLAHGLRDSDTVGTSLLQSGCEVRGVSLRQSHLDRRSEPAGLLPKPLDGPADGATGSSPHTDMPRPLPLASPAFQLCDTYTKSAQGSDPATTAEFGVSLGIHRMVGTGSSPGSTHIRHKPVWQRSGAAEGTSQASWLFVPGSFVRGTRSAVWGQNLDHGCRDGGGSRGSSRSTWHRRRCPCHGVVGGQAGEAADRVARITESAPIAV